MQHTLNKQTKDLFKQNITATNITKQVKSTDLIQETIVGFKLIW